MMTMKRNKKVHGMINTNPDEQMSIPTPVQKINSNNNTDILIKDKFLRQKLADIRHSKGLSQAEVAQLSGLSASTISNIESGSNSYTMRSLLMYANALGYDITFKKEEESHDTR